MMVMLAKNSQNERTKPLKGAEHANGDVTTGVEASVKENYRLRRYNPRRDEEECEAIESRSNQHQDSFIASMLFKANFLHLQGFTAELDLYRSGFVLVCEEISTGKVVGYVKAAIKHVLVGTSRERSHQEKVGYLFNLRVERRHQNRGLGGWLVNTAEEKCKANGTKYIYVSVNASNKSSQRLFKKLGYSLGSTRNILMKLVVGRPRQRKRGNSPVVAHLHDPDTIASILSKHQPHRNLTLIPAELAQVASSSLSYGMLFVESGTSCAGVCLWNGSALKTVQIKRLVIPVKVFQYRFWRWLALALFLQIQILAGRWAVVLEFRFYSTWMMPWYFRWSFALLLWFLLTSIFHHVMKFCTYFASTVSKENVDRFRFRAWAHFSSGEHGPQLLKHLLDHAHNIAHRHGFATLVWNMGSEDELQRHLKLPTSFHTQFLIKRCHHKIAFHPSEGDFFFDPRDI